jgi:hypothetical protein
LGELVEGEWGEDIAALEGGVDGDDLWGPEEDLMRGFVMVLYFFIDFFEWKSDFVETLLKGLVIF